MPIYKCHSCGREIVRPEGTYYCRVCGPGAVMVRERSRSEWESIARSIMEEVYERVYDWCWHISPEPASECFYTHAIDDLYSLASMYLREDVEEKLALLSEMPEDIYNKYNKKLQGMLERTAREIERKYGKPK